MTAAALPSFVRREVALGERTTLGVGGNAELFAETRSIAETTEALAWANHGGLDVVVLGGGSNMLIADRGVRGLVLRVLDHRRERTGDRVRVSAGHDWDELVAWSVNENLAGLECLSGIPGLVGATPIQNVGAYGQEVSETISEVEIIDRQTGELRIMSAVECEFAYRNSVFKSALSDRVVVVSVTFQLRANGAPALRYPELSRAMHEQGTTSPSLADTRETVIRLRRTKSMVFDQRDENRRSAGSFFMNPIIDSAELPRVRERVLSRGVLKEGESMPAFATADDRQKLSAAWLIERAGFTKGTTRGAVGISTKHSLALVNRGSATASDILSFAREVQGGVLEAFGVRLHPEPNLIGFTPHEISDLLD